MQKVRVNKGELLAVVQKNRDNHRAEFEKALAEYKEALTTYLNEKIEEVKAGRLVEHYIKLPQPEDHTDDYDQVLEMLAMSVDNEIELDYSDFARYVRDDWGWKGQFMASTQTLSTYNMEKKRR